MIRALPPFAAPLPPAAGKARRRARISITPLVDVVFILLIFFMLASSFLDWRMIELRAVARGQAPGVEGALLVDLRADGARLAGALLADAELERQVRERLARKPEQAVLLRPARGVDMQRTVAVLDRLAIAGVRELGLLPP